MVQAEARRAVAVQRREPAAELFVETARAEARGSSYSSTRKPAARVGRSETASTRGTRSARCRREPVEAARFGANMRGIAGVDGFHEHAPVIRQAERKSLVDVAAGNRLGVFDRCARAASTRNVAGPASAPPDAAARPRMRGAGDHNACSSFHSLEQTGAGRRTNVEYLLEAVVATVVRVGNPAPRGDFGSNERNKWSFSRAAAEPASSVRSSKFD